VERIPRKYPDVVEGSIVHGLFRQKPFAVGGGDL
jgi:hypothetical protein